MILIYIQIQVSRRLHLWMVVRQALPRRQGMGLEQSARLGTGAFKCLIRGTDIRFWHPGPRLPRNQSVYLVQPPSVENLVGFGRA